MPIARRFRLWGGCPHPPAPVRVMGKRLRQVPAQRSTGTRHGGPAVDPATCFARPMATCHDSEMRPRAMGFFTPPLTGVRERP